VTRSRLLDASGSFSECLVRSPRPRDLVQAGQLQRPNRIGQRWCGLLGARLGARGVCGEQFAPADHVAALATVERVLDDPGAYARRADAKSEASHLGVAIVGAARLRSAEAIGISFGQFNLHVPTLSLRTHYMPRRGFGVRLLSLSVARILRIAEV
jgi:hypothetical protein